MRFFFTFRLREGVHVEESEIENNIDYTAIPLQKHYEQKIEEMQEKLNQKTTECNLINKQLERFLVSRYTVLYRFYIVQCI